MLKYWGRHLLVNVLSKYIVLVHFSAFFSLIRNVRVIFRFVTHYTEYGSYFEIEILPPSHLMHQMFPQSKVEPALTIKTVLPCPSCSLQFMELHLGCGTSDVSSQAACESLAVPGSPRMVSASTWQLMLESKTTFGGKPVFKVKSNEES